AAADERPLERADCEPDDRDDDPARAPRPDVRRHVGAGAEEAQNGNREGLLGLACNCAPRPRLGESLCRPQVKEAESQDGGRPDADPERDDVQEENGAVCVHTVTLRENPGGFKVSATSKRRYLFIGRAGYDSAPRGGGSSTRDRVNSPGLHGWANREAAMANGSIHTVPKGSQWVNEIEGEGAIGGSHATKEEAVLVGR